MKIQAATLAACALAAQAIPSGVSCGRETLDRLSSSGFTFSATCTPQGEDLLVSIVLGPATVSRGPAPRELRKIKLSFSGTLVRADAPPGYEVTTDTSEQPKRLTITWLRTPAADGRVERGDAAFQVRLSGPAPAILCPFEFATEHMVGGMTCDIPPSPADTRVESAAMSVVGLQHPAAAGHPRGR